MTKSGYLPDISGNFTRWRQYYLDGLGDETWPRVALGLHNMNGALDEEYRLPVSDKGWIEKEPGYIVWDCPNCTELKKITVNKGKENEYKKEVEIPTRSKRSDITIFEEKCDDVVSLLSGMTKRKMWVCPVCKNTAPVFSVKATLLKYPEPHYRECIYSEPERPLTGLKRRRGSYPEQMRIWAKNYSHELEHKLALYRLEYIKQHETEMEFGWQDKGDQ